ncbi:hypothetical protein AHAS_Ahas08G0029600 [Arachis hypogaea]
MGQEFSHEGVNSEHTSYDQYEQEEETHEEVDVDYMDEDDTNVEPVFDYHGFDEGLLKSNRRWVGCCWIMCFLVNDDLKNRSTGELSFLTSLMNSAGSMVRVFTSLQENAPKSVVMGSAIGVDTNFTILSQILFYQKPRVTEKEKKTK